ncbi:MAG: MFS transporter [Chloroflexi bacterium]|nr:MFS transporter [Chloroflexota bacterium]
MAGWLIQTITAPLAISLDALSFLASALCFGAIRTPEPPPCPRDERGNVWREISEGLHFVAYDRLLRPLAASGAITTGFGGVFGAGYVLYVTQELGLSPAGIGVMEAIRYVGFLAGTLVAGRAAHRLGVGPATVAGLSVLGLGWLLVPFVPLVGGTAGDTGLRPIGLTLLAAGHVLTGFGNTLGTVNGSSLRQMATPDRLIGRMHTTFRFVGRGSLPLGALLGGVLGESIGVSTTLAVGAMGMLLGPLWLVFSPVGRLRSLPTPEVK